MYTRARGSHKGYDEEMLCEVVERVKLYLMKG